MENNQGEPVTEHELQTLTVTDVVRLARSIYADAQGVVRHKQTLRPHICPFHVLVSEIPAEASILDVGCGAGLFIFLLVRLGRVRSAVGFDADRAAILTAQEMAARLPNSELIQFERRNANDAWPPGRFDVVCLIDVMHHVLPDHQAAVFAAAIEHVADGGILLYKDMASRPLWRAWANRLHDLLLANQWINYIEREKVIRWARKSGLSLERTGEINMLWYRHEWCIFRKSCSISRSLSTGRGSDFSRTS